MPISADNVLCFACNSAFQNAVVVGILGHRIQDERWVHNGDFALELREKRERFTLRNCKFSA